MPLVEKLARGFQKPVTKRSKRNNVNSYLKTALLSEFVFLLLVIGQKYRAPYFGANQSIDALFPRLAGLRVFAWRCD